MRSLSASRSTIWARTAWRTFWLWRSQSRAPREKSSYQGDSVPNRMRLATLSRVMACSPGGKGSASAGCLLLGEQRGHVVERLPRAMLVVGIVVDEALGDRRDLLLRLLLGPGGGGDQPEHVAPLLEEVLRDGVVERRVGVERELLAALVRPHRLAHHFLPERVLARVGDLDLLLDRAQHAFVGVALLVGDRIAQLAVVERGLDLVDILVEKLLRLLFEGHEQRLVHVLL